MMRPLPTTLLVLCFVVVAVTAATAAAGLLGRGDSSVREVTSIRGETYEAAASGVYAHSPMGLVSEGVGWDIVTLFLAVPLLIVSLVFVGRGSMRARVLTIGLLAYLFYQYLMYAVTYAFGPLFVPFIVVYALSLVTVIWMASTLDYAQIASDATDRFPATGTAVLAFSVAALLVIMWGGRILTAYREGVAGVLEGQSTLVVQAMDLGLIVPLAILTGVLALKRSAAGCVLCGVFVVKAFTMAVAICAMLIAEWLIRDTLEIPPLVIFGVIAALSLWLGVRAYRALPAAPQAQP